MIKVKKSVEKEVKKLPKKIQILYLLFLEDLKRDGVKIKGWDLIKMSGSTNEYRAKLNQSYRVIIEYIRPDLIIVKVASREGVYK